MTPNKLKDDAIVEALCEVRFDSEEDFPELVLGRLSDLDLWRNFKKQRLPISDIPTNVRQLVEGLKYQPVFELQEDEGARRVKLGSNVVSYHIVGVDEYVGWKLFEPMLREMFAQIFGRVKVETISRIGLRYTNALTSSRHFVSDIRTLDVDICVAGQTLDSPKNLNFLETHGPAHTSITRIASPDFVHGPLPQTTTAIVDVDVFSNPDFQATSVNEAIEWVNKAHGFEKEAFFKLIPKSILERLIEV